MSHVTKLISIVGSVFLLVTVSGCASQSADPQAAAYEEPGLNRIVCHEEVKTGSRVGKKKVCKSLAEWEEEAAMNEDAKRNMMRRPAARVELPSIGN